MILDTSALLAVLFDEPDADYAEATQEPLLLKGMDFSLTDIETV